MKSVVYDLNWCCNYLQLVVFFLSCLMSCMLFCSAAEVAGLSESHDLCINGDCFEMLQSTEAVLQVIPYVKVCVNRLHPLYRI